MTITQTIIFTIGAIAVILGVWCLVLSIQNMRIERYKNEKR